MHIRLSPCQVHITVEALKRGFFDAYEILNAENEQERNIQAALYYDLKSDGGLRKKLCKRYLTKLDKAKITGISLI